MEFNNLLKKDFNNLLKFNVSWNYKTVSLFIFLLIIPNILGMINFSTIYGFKLHFFQLAIFLAAVIYGPKGGLLSGMVGSAYSAILMNNPYIVIGNMLLGFFVGLLIRMKFNVILAVLGAFLIQLPYLIVTDYYLIHMPWMILSKLIIALFISNTLWATITHFSKNKLLSFVNN